MFAFLEAFLEASVTPEQKAVFMNACRVLWKAGFTDHAFVIEQELNANDSLDADSARAMLTQYLLPLYREQLAAFGVQLSEEATLAQAVDVFEALLSIEDYEDRETLCNLCDGDEDATATLADILGLLGTTNADEYLTILDMVNPSLIERIEELTRTDEAEVPTDEDLVARNRARVEKLLAIIRDGQPDNVVPGLHMAERFIAEGGRMGTAHDMIVEPYREQLETLPPRQLAQELLLLLFLTHLDTGAIYPAFGVELDLLHLDHLKVGETDKQVRLLLEAVDHA